MGHDVRKTDFIACEQQRRNPAYADTTQTDPTFVICSLQRMISKLES